MSIPISILLYALEKKKVNQLKLYLFLKSISSGQLTLSDEVQTQVCEALEWKDKRTYQKNLKWLLKNHWATLNRKTNSLRIVSYRQLHKQINGSVLSGARMNQEDFKTFRPFIYAAIISWAVFAKKKYKIMSESNEGHSKSSIKYLISNNMPNRYLAKILHINQSSIARYKNEAQKGKYISIKHQNINTGLEAAHLPLMRKYADEKTKNSIYIKNGIIHIRDADIITPRIKLTYLKHLKKPP